MHAVYLLDLDHSFGQPFIILVLGTNFGASIVKTDSEKIEVSRTFLNHDPESLVTYLVGVNAD